MRIYLTGADGMLGSALLATLYAHPATEQWPVLGVSLADFDIADAAAVHASVDAFGPDVVVHAAAHAIVDDCEADPTLALRVNTAGVRNVVEACRRNRSRLVYLSSDYVFDGLRTPPGGYRETDVPNPVSVYGLTKLAGERISALLPDHLNIRTSWLFGGVDERVDVVLRTLRRAGRGLATSLVADQFSVPTYTVDLAGAIVRLLTLDTPVIGTLHVANTGTASWYEVGRHALRHVDPRLADRVAPIPVAIADCGFRGGRPQDSTLNTDLLTSLGCRLPDWTDAVDRFCRTLDLRPVAAQMTGPTS